MDRGQFVILILSVLAQTWGQPPPECTEEEYRPRYHFSPAREWLNDPNGMVYYSGAFHLYYQYDPVGMGGGPKHWGHAISTDMAFWEEVEVALYPDELGAIWSGSAVVDYDNTTGFQTDPFIHPIIAMFTHAGDQGQFQSIAYSNDYGFTFTKYQGNPVIPNPGIVDFRDPKVVRYEGKWVVVVAAGNHIDFYSSDDMKVWTKTSEFGQDPEQGNHGGIWECPDFVKLSVDFGNGTVGEMWVLMISTWNHPNRGAGTHYLVGYFNGTHFTSTGWHPNQWVEWGQDNYAGQTFSNDPQGRTIHMAWMANLAYAGSLPTSTWRGQITLPRQLGLRLVSGDGSRGEDYRMTSVLVTSIENLRSECFEYEGPYELQENVIFQLGNSQSRSEALELIISLEMENEPEFEICATNFNTQDQVCLNFVDNTWILDRSETSNTGFNGEFAQMLRATAPRELPAAGNNATVRIFMDVSSFEVYTDEGLVTMTSLYYPDEPLFGLYVRNAAVEGRDTKLVIQYYNICKLQCDHGPL